MRSREPWSEQEQAELRTMLSIGMSMKDAARRLRRTEESTRMYARKHNLLIRQRRRS